MRRLNRIRYWWRHLAWFDVRRARDWQAVIILMILVAILMIVATVLV